MKERLINCSWDEKERIQITESVLERMIQEYRHVCDVSEDGQQINNPYCHTQAIRMQITDKIMLIYYPDYILWRTTDICLSISEKILEEAF